MATITNNPNTAAGRYMLLVDSSEFALMTALAKLDVIIRLMDPGPDKEQAIAQYNTLDRELTYMKDKDSAWIQGNGSVRAPSAAEVVQTQDIADKLEKVTVTEQGYARILTLAGDIVNVVNGIFGAPPAPAGNA
jgi:hypothetical protein